MKLTVLISLSLFWSSVYFGQDFNSINFNLKDTPHNISNHVNESFLLNSFSSEMVSKGYQRSITSDSYNLSNSDSQLNAILYRSAFNVGYHYIGKGRNSGYLGVDFRGSDRGKPALNLGLGTYLTSIDDQFKVLPAIQANYSLYDFALIEVASSNQFFKPSLGFNILNIIQLKLGYSFWYKESRFNSLTFGLNFCLGGDDFYDALRMY